MSTISVKTHFAAGHRILGLEGPGAKCRNIHGHTFHVTWMWEQHPDIEFGRLKSNLRGVCSFFDHAFILDKTDDFVRYLEANMLQHYPLNGPPTTENIAAELARLAILRLTQPRESMSPGKDMESAIWPDAKLLSVCLEEGPENSATWTRGLVTEIENWQGDTIATLADLKGP